ncbi:hypothetical protein BC835DRAFT_1218683, partial [Cytidiella melzeri]
IKDSDIPSRTKLTQAVQERALVVQERLREELKNLPGQISITFDAWTSGSMDPYLSVTAHYIDNLPSG